MEIAMHLDLRVLKPRRWLARRLMNAALIAGSLLLAACGGSPARGPLAHGLTPAGPSTILPAAGALPAFPDERQTRGLTQTVIAGKDALQRSAGADEIGTALQLSATLQPESAVYRFQPGAGSLDSVNVLLEAGATTGAFIGLADFAAQRWVFSGPYSGAKTLALDSPSYVSPQGNVWIAVLAPQGTAALINALSVRTVDPGNQPPLASLTTDVTTGAAPLLVNFYATDSTDPDGQLIEYAWDWDDDGIYDGFTDVPFAAHTFATAGEYAVRLRVTDDRFARATAAVSVTVNALANAKPFAEFTLSDSYGQTPFKVDFNAAGSHDSDGSIALYEWDWDNDGVYDASASINTASHTFVASGKSSVRLRVTDDRGAQSTTTRNLTVAGWAAENTPLDAGGAQSCLARIGGVPVIAYYSPEGLKFARASFADGSSWGDSVVLDARFTSLEFYPALAVASIGGCPAIVAAADALYYFQATDSAGQHWNAPVVVDASPSDLYFSLAEVNGKPAVAFSDYGQPQSRLFFTQAADSTGTAWLPPLQLGSGNHDTTPSLQVVNNRPAVAYFDQTQSALCYVSAVDPNGLAWNTPQELDNSSYVGMHPSLQVVSGCPAISYAGSGQARYIRAVDADGLNWSPSLQIDTFSGYGHLTGLAVVNNRPAVVYDSNEGPGLIRLCFALDALGTVWGPPHNISSDGVSPALVGDTLPVVTFNTDDGLFAAHEF